MGKRCHFLSFFIACVIIAASLFTWNLGLQQALDQKKAQLKLFAELVAESNNDQLPSNHNTVAEQHGFTLYTLVSNRDGSVRILPSNNDLSQNFILQAIVQSSGYLPQKITPVDQIFYKHTVDLKFSILVSSSLTATKSQYIETTKYPMGLMLLTVIILLVIYSVFYNKKSQQRQQQKQQLKSKHNTEFLITLNDQFEIIESSPSFKKTLPDTTSQSFISIVKNNEQKDVQQQLEQVIKSNAHVIFECTVNTNFGAQNKDQEPKESRWAVTAVKQTKSNQLQLSAVDISKHHSTKLKLRKERHRIETYLDVMHSLLIISDSAGNIIETNDQFNNLIEANTDDLTGQNIQKFFPASAHHQLKTNLHTLSQSANDTVSLVMPILAKSGKEFVIDWRITAIPEDEHSHDGFDILLTGLDITESIANNQALKIANNKIREALNSAEGANQSKSVFLANMSHEIRTPMNGILGATELLLDQAANDEQKQLVDIIHTSSNALLNIINDILDLSKIESGNFELEQINFDLHDLCKNAYQLFSSPAQKKGIQVVYYYQAELPQFWVGDPNRIRQVINNLLSNALKFTHSGRIDLLVTGERLTNHQFDITISVKDTGIGIAEKKVKQIFTAFKQADANTSRKYGGTGLGLTISKHLANAMQGDIGVSSVLGLGSTFALKLPLKPGKTEAVAKRTGLARDYHANVLLAEDNPVNAKIASKILHKLGIQTVVVENGKLALEEVTNKNYDIVLMDINMPILDGISAAEKIRQLPFPRNQIPILALTANAMMEDRERCMDAGMNGFVSKPINIAHLIDELDSILSSHAK